MSSTSFVPALRPSAKTRASRSRLLTLLVWLRLLGFGIVVASIFMPYLVSMVYGTAFLAAGGLAIYSIAELARRDRLTAWLPFWAIVVPIAFAATYLLSRTSTVEAASLGDIPDLVRNFGLVAPLAVATGLVAAGDAELSRLFAVVRGFAGASAALAVVEYARGAVLLPGNTVTKVASGNTVVDSLALGGGGVRAIVAADHPLVLAALLATTVPLALRARGWRKWPEVLLLVAGIYATDSSGPLGLAILAIALSVVLSRRPIGSVGARTAIASVPVFGGVFLWASSLLTPVIDPDNPLDASTQYRFGLYSLMPRIMTTHPFGYGPGQTPGGEFLVESYRAIIDVAKTVDSELVLSVIRYGLVGYLTFFALLLVAVIGSVTEGPGRPAALAMLLLIGTGFFLALQVWLSVLMIWALLLGITVGSLARRRAYSASHTGGNP